MPDQLLRRWATSRVNVQLPDGTTHESVMLVVTQGRARIIGRRSSGDLVVREGATRRIARSRNQWALLFDGEGEGDVWLVTKDRNCGCGGRKR